MRSFDTFARCRQTDMATRTRRKNRRRPASGQETQVEQPSLRGLTGGRYQPLDPADLPKIDAAVRSILSDVGMTEAPDIVIEHVTRAGGSLDADGRLHFTLELIDNALQGLARDFTLC